MDPRFPDPKMRDEFRRELRARVMQEAPNVLAPRRGTAWTFLRSPALGIGLAGILLVAGAGTAAAGSLPGDAAFSLKRVIEDVQVNLTFDDVQRVQLLAQIADRRLDELQKVAERSDKAPTASEEFAQAVARFRAAVDAIQQAAPADKSEKVQDVVDAARAKHEAVLDEVQQKVDNEKARDAIERAKDDENKDTKGERDSQKNDPKKSPRPARTATPTRTPRPSPSVTPRASERTTAPGRSATPRPSATGERED